MSSSTTAPAPARSGLDSYFGISRRGSSIAQEVRGGLVTFFTMAYIVVLNPIILGNIPDADGNFLGGKLPSGDGIAGGTFESWFRVTYD